MKKIIVSFAIVLLFLACNQNKVPKNVIDQDKMIDVLVDMQITDAYLNQVYNPDTQKMQAHSRYNYLFKKHKIDSTKFSESLKYYSLDPKRMEEMYTLVDDSLSRYEESLKPKPKKVKKLKKN